MKKTIFLFVFLLFFVFAGTVMAKGGAKNGDYVAWKWWRDKSIDIEVYFLKTGSGIVHGWVYDHPEWGDVKYMFKL